MYVFLLTAIPLLTATALNCCRGYWWREFVPQMALGLFAAMAACCVREFFIFSTHLWTERPVDAFTYLLLRDALVPVAALAAVHLLCGLPTGDSWEYRLFALFPLCASFFAAYIPYYIIAGGERHGTFPLVVKPVLFAALALLEGALGGCAARQGGRGKAAPAIAAAAGMTAAVPVPALAETLWYFRQDSPAWLVAAAAYAAAAVAAFVPFARGGVPGAKKRRRIPRKHRKLARCH